MQNFKINHKPNSLNKTLSDNLYRHAITEQNTLTNPIHQVESEGSSELQLGEQNNLTVQKLKKLLTLFKTNEIKDAMLAWKAINLLLIFLSSQEKTEEKGRLLAEQCLASLKHLCHRNPHLPSYDELWGLVKDEVSDISYIAQGSIPHQFKQLLENLAPCELAVCALGVKEYLSNQQIEVPHFTYVELAKATTKSEQDTFIADHSFMFFSNHAQGFSQIHSLVGSLKLRINLSIQRDEKGWDKLHTTVKYFTIFLAVSGNKVHIPQFKFLNRRAFLNSSDSHCAKNNQITIYMDKRLSLEQSIALAKQLDIFFVYIYGQEKINSDEYQAKFGVDQRIEGCHYVSYRDEQVSSDGKLNIHNLLNKDEDFFTRPIAAENKDILRSILTKSKFETIFENKDTNSDTARVLSHRGYYLVKRYDELEAKDQQVILDFCEEQLAKKCDLSFEPVDFFCHS